MWYTLSAYIYMYHQTFFVFFVVVPKSLNRSTRFSLLNTHFVFLSPFCLQGEEVATTVINVSPCDPNGKPLKEDVFVEDPSELLGKPYHFKV